MTDTSEAETPISAHEAWMEDWRSKFVQDSAALDKLKSDVKGQWVRITIYRGSSDDNPDERVTTEGRVMGAGRDLLWAADGSSEVTRMSLVLDNGHAHLVRQGMKFERKVEPKPGVKRQKATMWEEVADFPPV